MILTYFHIIVFSMIPVLELRFAIPFGVANGVPLWLSLTLSIIGNLLPVPFILLLLRFIFSWMKTHSRVLGKIVIWLEEHAQKKGKNLYRSVVFGLFLLVAIPLPGTGAWTGSLVASVLNIRMKVAFPAIVMGVIVAGVITSIITYGASALFF